MPTAQRLRPPVNDAQEVAPDIQDHPVQPASPVAMDSPDPQDKEADMDHPDQRDQWDQPVSQDSQEVMGSQDTPVPMVNARARDPARKELPVNQEDPALPAPPVTPEAQEEWDPPVQPVNQDTPASQEVMVMQDSRDRLDSQALRPPTVLAHIAAAERLKLDGWKINVDPFLIFSFSHL